ncbi:response regulator [Paracoccus sp. S-4012]|uniref:response regulator n=1 Tax=Paracoccus sp. S-4012 TaxID=2665648 RepID=UPI0012B0DD8E|nr:sigma-54 dependent transcriptional regulator [Paracoccus sp. S-4012]MRX51539.1 response regulator [Paracoccus sp. S-4012]
MDGTVLIADDDRTIRTVLTQALTRAGCKVHATGSLAQLAKWVEEARPDLVITDVVMPDGNGIDVIPALKKARPDLPVIVISAQNTIVTAVRAQAADAFDYLPKPFDLPELMGRARAALDRRRRLSPAAPEAVPQADPTLPLVGHAPAMQALFRQVARLLEADLPVLIAGEAGAGRTTLARSLHELSSRRDRGVTVLSPADASDAAFERARQAGATGGTLLVEDPAGMDPAAQARLAALLETLAAAPEPPRVVATTEPEPQAAIAAGRLRADLYWRLAGATLTIPPLRSRAGDIPALARHLLARVAAQGLPARELSDSAAAALRAHAFPGNVRELENLVARLALTATAAEITEAEVRAALDDAPESLPPAPATGPAVTRLADAVEAQLRRYFDLHGEVLPPAGLYDRVLAEVERPLIELTLEATGGNQLRAADLLGINRNTLRKKVNALNIGVTRRRRLM